MRELGDGFSVSVSAEEPTSHFKSGTLDGATAAFAANGVTVTNNHGIRMPDFIGNLRVIQAWGTAGISGAIHDVSAAYFGATDLTTNGHPDSKFGWAVSAAPDQASIRRHLRRQRRIQRRRSRLRDQERQLANL